MPPSEHFHHRPAVRKLDDTDAVDIAPSDLPEKLSFDELPLLAGQPLQDQQRLNVAEVHDFAATEARLRQLSGTERSKFIDRSQRDNHQATKQQVIDSLRAEVIPDSEAELSPHDAEYFQGLDQSLSEIFSGEPDENGNSRLEQEFETVLSIESIEDEAEQEAARRGYIAGLAQRLGARPEDAEAIYWRLAEQPEVYRALKQQRQVLLLIEHEPERYE